MRKAKISHRSSIFFCMYFAYRFHVETGNPSIHYLLQTPHLFFCSKVRANPDCEFSEACLCRKGQGTSFGWLLTVKNCSELEYVHVSPHLYLSSSDLCIWIPALQEKGKEGIALLEVKCEGCRSTFPLEAEHPTDPSRWGGSLAQIPLLQTTRAPWDVHWNRPSKHHYYGVSMALMSTL